MNKTNYDLFQELKKTELDDKKRHTLEGAIIISSALETAEELGISISKDRYGYESAKRIFNNLSKLEYENDKSDISKFKNSLYLPEKYESLNLRNFHELLRTTIRITNLFYKTNNLDYLLLENIGKRLDSNFERLYIKRGLEIDPEKRTEKTQTKILKIEAFYFGINARETYRKSRR
ncbi:hypothetical protein GOV08_00345 [Candidatus Woesearchaeota archaeon]|nr:hypothetical protein [Candidatus Woesearchaeota archaeon]